jgi:hypothetical protein
MLDSMTGQYCDGETDDTKKDQDVEGYANKTCKKALSVFYATCKDKGLDYTKPTPKEKVREHVSAILPFTILEKIVDKPLRIRGLAITAGMSRNFNIYTPEELQAFASKLVAAPMYVEHVAVPNAVGKVTKTEWDGENLWYEAEIYDDETAAQIRKGLIQHVSVGADYETIDIFDGQIPHGLHNAELSLVAVPGIPEANVQVLEKLLRKKEQQVVQPIVAGEYLLGFYQDVCLFLPEHFRTVWLDKENGILAVFGKLRVEPETERVQAIFFAKEKMWDQTKIQNWLSLHPDYMAPAGDSAVGKAPLIERGNMKKKRKVKEQVAQPEPKDDKQRFMNHTKIDEETFQLLYAAFGDELFTLLPERGQKVDEQNGEGNLTVDQIKAKIADLSKKNADIMAQLYPEAELTDEQRATLNAESETIWAEINALETALAAAITADVGATLGEGYQVVLEVKLKEAEWDTEYINNLPDSSFAFIESGGDKDEEGKTKPRELRHLPFKDAQGNINKAHLNNALGRLAQTDLSDEAKAAAKKKLCAAVKTWNGAHSDDQITSDVCGVQPSTEEKLETRVLELAARIKKLEQIQGERNLAESLLKNSKEPTIKVTEAIKILEGLLPSPMVERSSMGMQRECQAIRGAVLQLKEMLKNG